MTDILKKISLEAVKFDYQILVCILAVWFLVLGCAISSIASQPFSKKERWFWILLILGVPALGLLSYIPFSFRKENYPGLFKVNK